MGYSFKRIGESVFEKCFGILDKGYISNFLTEWGLSGNYSRLKSGDLGQMTRFGLIIISLKKHKVNEYCTESLEK